MHDEDLKTCPHCRATVTGPRHTCASVEPSVEGAPAFFSPEGPSKREVACYVARHIDSGNYRVAIMIVIGGVLMQRQPHWMGLVTLIYAFFPIRRALQWMSVFDIGDLYGDEYERARRQVKRSFWLWVGASLLLLALFGGLVLTDYLNQMAAALDAT